jgi:hypothetical protein
MVSLFVGSQISRAEHHRTRVRLYVNWLQASISDVGGVTLKGIPIPLRSVRVCYSLWVQRRLRTSSNLTQGMSASSSATRP